MKQGSGPGSNRGTWGHAVTRQADSMNQLDAFQFFSFRRIALLILALLDAAID